MSNDKYNDVKYDKVRNTIKNLIDKRRSYEYVLYGGGEDCESLDKLLESNNLANDWGITRDDWFSLVNIEIEEDNSMMKVEEKESITFSNKEFNNFLIPQNRNSTWQTFKNKTLREDLRFDESTISNIEKDIFQIVKNLSVDTAQMKPIKGLVIGSVQSGKTTNIAGLMAMASDMGFNMFIILTGMIENLREQNENRIFQMISNTNGKQVNWHKISDVKNRNERLNNVYRESNAFYILSLKQKDRLSQLINWLQEDPNYSKELKILVIDDEADQASVNTSNDTKDRKKINSLIINLIHGFKSNGKKYDGQYAAVNYIGYTATPYANILSEEPNEFSLYPKDFITILSKSKSHFGPQEIFGQLGTENDGLNVVRIIDQKLKASDLKRPNVEIPIELKESIAYFIAAGASLRKHNYNKPVSMLVQVSHLIKFHQHLNNKISIWLNKNKEEVLDFSKNVWEREKNSIDITDFSGKVFVKKNTLIPHDYDEIESEIIKILNEISQIKRDANTKKTIYHNGIHIVIDNSDSKNKSDKYQFRLEYPTIKEDLDKTPLFLVIGGDTLSRGLTLQGLVSSFFLRSTGAADTLTQMGRWFGYRIGYELYPRIWITKKAQNQFEYIASLEEELREEIYQMRELSLSPEEVGPNIKYLPQYINVTSRNKSYAMVSSKYNFAGFSSQTYIFDNNLKDQIYNLKITREFIQSLGIPHIIKNKRVDSVFWSKIDFEDVFNNLLKKFKFNKRIKSLNNLDALYAWVKKSTHEGKLETWNIILSGLGKANTALDNWYIDYFENNKVSRTKKKSSLDNEINIGVLRGPIDLYKDINKNELSKENLEIVEKAEKTGYRKDYIQTREILGLSKIPQLFIYKINKYSKPTGERLELGIDSDLVGLYISIPGDMANQFTTYVTVDIKKESPLDFDEEDFIDDL